MEIDMAKNLVPFWEETYPKDYVITFSVEPNRTIKEKILINNKH